MEAQFDELAKALAGGLSRRDVLRRLGGGLVVGLLASLGLARGASAQVGRGGSICPSFCRNYRESGPEDFQEFARCVRGCEEAHSECRQERGELVRSELDRNVLICCPEGAESEAVCEPVFPQSGA